jgi:hypothetical protein
MLSQEDQVALPNLVDELDVLKNAMDGECALRKLAQAEQQKGIPNGPMLAAHVKAVRDCLDAANALLKAAGI